MMQRRALARFLNNIEAISREKMTTQHFFDARWIEKLVVRKPMITSLG
jgi:hypothetical protein